MPNGTSDLSLHIPDRILYSQFRGPYILNDANASNGGGDAGDGDKGDGGDGKQDDGSKGDDKGSDDKKSDTEGRITQLAKEKKELERELKRREDADKKAAEDKLKEEGKLQELLQAKDKELADLTGSSASMTEKLTAYEEIAKEQISKALESIADKDRRADAEALLEGRDIAEQFKLIPKLLKLAGGTQSGAEFGGKTPASQKQVGADNVDQKKARYEELLGKPELKPAEQAEMNRLMMELSDVWNKEKSEKTS